MADYTTLKTAVQIAIKTNNNNEITGKILQQQLLAMINSLGSDYQLAGILRPLDIPKTGDQRIAYLAVEPGMYEHAGGFEVTELSLLMYDTAWEVHPLGVPFGSQIAAVVKALQDADKANAKAIADEKASRTTAILAEQQAREQADTTLQENIDKKQDTISDLTTIRTQAAHGQTAFSWGDHSKVGYITGITKAMVEDVLTGNITSHTHTFASLTDKPTTISGYGIRDAYTKAETDRKVVELQGLIDSMFERVYDSNNKLIRVHSNVTISSSGDLVAGSNSGGGGTSGGAYTQLEWNAIKALTQSESGLLASAYSVKEAYNELNTAIETLAGKATNVKFTQTLTSGKQIGSISIDGKSTSLFAPANYAWSEVTGKPTFATVATSGSYTDLTNKPTIASLMGSTAIGGTSSYLYWNGSAWATKALGNNAFTNISKVSQLTNDSGYITGITKSMVEGVLTGNITSHTHSYLPLAGGTLTGDLYINTNLYGPSVGSNPRNRYDSGLYFFNCNGSTTSEYNFGLYQWNDEFQFTFRTSSNNLYKGTAFTIQGSDGQVAFTKTPKVGSTLVSLEGHTHSYLPLSGGTMSNTNVVTNLNADLLDGYHHSSFAKVASSNDFIVGGNEFNFVPSAFAGTVHFNYRTTGGKNGTISQYKFCDGAGGDLATISAGQFSGNAASSTQSLLLSNTSDAKAVSGVNFHKSNGSTSLVGNTEGNGVWGHPSDSQDKSYGNASILRIGWDNAYYTDIFTGPNLAGGKYGLQWRQIVNNGANAWRTILDSSNYNSYAPKLDGTGASGTWGINISGNAATATNADKLDNIDSTGFLQNYSLNYGDTISNAVDISPTLTAGLARVHISKVEFSSVLTGYDFKNKAWQLRFRPSHNDGIYFRSQGTGTSWKQIAFTDSNVASATKLANSRTIWGQSFDGTGNVSGALTEVTSITASSTIQTSGNIIASGDITAGSDIRYKNKIQDLRLSVRDIALAPAFTYKWNNRNDALIHIGSSAQYWLNTDAKDAVYYDKQNDFYHLNYASLALCNTIILARGMETQEEKIVRLEERIKELEERVKQFEQ